MNNSIRTALISVSDKTGLADFARGLSSLGFKILSTGGTARFLAEHAIPVTEVADHTGFPEILDGRVKTLHPKIHGGILARRDSGAHMDALASNGITPIDLVAVNLYPFSRTVERPGCELAEAIENIDIGGPSMLRSAAKNYQGVAVVCDPADYPGVLAELRAGGGMLETGSRLRLAHKAFAHSAQYDAAIDAYFTRVRAGEEERYPRRLELRFDKVQEMRYGENPHQSAALYRDISGTTGGVAAYTQLQGKALSYNNIADADAAWECVKTFADPACVIVKHANPCGAAVGILPREAYERAFATDPTSAFGGVVAFNRAMDGATAEAVSRQFVEVVIAPEFAESALAVLKPKSNVRLLAVPSGPATHVHEFKRVGGGLLVQSPDAENIDRSALRTVTRLQPTPEQIDDLLFAWRVAKYVKSNAIVYCGRGRTLGIGAGQVSRVDAARVGAIKAQSAELSLIGSAVASDAFFPFRDGIDVVARAGATSIIQPGGSLRDEEVIAAADELGLAMVFTGVRHFRH